MICGVLLLDKPLGLSSSAATQRVRRLFGGVKAGHVGSLDPLATGMLPICLGEATKIAGDVLEGRKRYRFTIGLGVRTATGDAEGEVVERLPVPHLDETTVRVVLAAFLGRQAQVPPMYSAVKQGGQPLYRLARQGQVVERAARHIEIHELQLRELSESSLELEVACSKGTYVRVLAEEVAAALGTCGFVSALRRESVEPFDAAAMITLPELESRLAGGAGADLLIPPECAIGHLPALLLQPADVDRVRHGQSVQAPPTLPMGQRVRLQAASDGRLVGLAIRQSDGAVWPKRLLVEAQAAE